MCITISIDHVSNITLTPTTPTLDAATVDKTSMVTAPTLSATYTDSTTVLQPSAITTLSNLVDPLKSSSECSVPAPTITGDAAKTLEIGTDTYEYTVSHCMGWAVTISTS